MQVQIEELSPVEKRLAIEIEWPMVAAKLDQAYKELGRDVTLKGFRKGKVPRNILEKMFARQVEQEVAKQLVQESFVRAARQHELLPVAEPIVDNVEMAKDKGFRYSARVEVKASIEPQGYEGVELEKPEPSVSVEEIDRALERKREELAEYKRIEGRDTLGATDVVIFDVAGELDGKPFKKDGAMIDLSRPEGDGSEPLPGLRKALLGAPVTAKDHPVELTLPVKQEGDAPRHATLKLTVRESREKSVPALDDDFAKDTGEADTLDELRGKLREQLLAEKDREVKQQLRSALIKELLKKNEFQVAPSLVERQADVLIQRAKMSMAMQGVDIRNVPLDENRMRDQLRGAAEDEVRAAFLIEAIADKEKVEVAEADLEKRLAEMARGRDTSVARLKAELQKEGRFDSLRFQLREEKTLDLLLTRANIKPRIEAETPSEK